jgi:hypothetical protein
MTRPMRNMPGLPYMTRDVLAADGGCCRVSAFNLC